MGMGLHKILDTTKMPDKVTYKLIQQYVEEHYGFKVHTAYVAEVKRKLGFANIPSSKCRVKSV